MSVYKLYLTKTSSRAPPNSHDKSVAQGEYRFDLLPETKRANKYIIIHIDYSSKWPEAAAIPSKEARTCVPNLLLDTFRRYGWPKIVLSDQGGN